MYARSRNIRFRKKNFANYKGNYLTMVELSVEEAELYDRQIRLWGLDSQKRIRGAHILLCGLNGFGAEIAKNLILSGIKSIRLLDHRVLTEEDRCSQFLAPFDAIGKNRAEASLERAKALNPLVAITVDTDDIKDKKIDYFVNFDVVIISEGSQETLLNVNEMCRTLKLKFFTGDVWGLFGYSFSDMLDHCFAEDVVKRRIISKPDEKLKTEAVTITSKREFIFPKYEKFLNFDFDQPAFRKTFKHTGPAFVVVRILLKFRENEKRDPDYKSHDEDVVKLLKIRDEISNSEVVSDEYLNKNIFSRVSPTAAIVGAALSQEIIKCIAQKERPNDNVFLFDPIRCSGFVQLIL